MGETWCEHWYWKGRVMKARDIFTVAVMVLTTLIICVAMTAGTASGAQPPAVLLEQGIFHEETAGSIDKAMRIYRQIINNHRANRKYVAEAHYRLGKCLLKKKDKAGAAAEFRKVIAMRGAQKVLVAKAKVKLARLGGVSSSSKRGMSLGFPELVGCRLRETVKLKLTTSRRGRKVKLSVPDLALLALESEIPARIAGKLKAVSIDVRRLDLVTGESERVESFTNVVPSGVMSKESSEKSLRELSQKASKTIMRQGAGAYRVRVLAFTSEPNKNQTNTRASVTLHLTVTPLIYTQIGLRDIQPDGTMRFSSGSQRINTSGRTVSYRRFRNSDFVKIKRMFDGDGKDIVFEVWHKGRHYNYYVTLNKPVGQGAPVLMGSSGTMAAKVTCIDSRKGIWQYRMNHRPGGNGPTRRVEIYRLPKGAKLTGVNASLKAKRKVDGRWELYIEKIIPAGGNILTMFTYRLPGSKPSAAKPLEVGPAPWADGEVMRLSVTTKAGMRIGEIKFTARLVDAPAGRSGTKAAASKSSGVMGAMIAAAKAVMKGKMWRIESYMSIPMAGIRQYTRVDAAGQAMLPIFSRTRNQAADFVADYSVGKIVARRNGKHVKNVKLSKVAYDNEQAIFLIRTLPLKKGYEAEFPIYVPQSGSVVKCIVKVVDEEKVSWAGGEMLCYAVQLTARLGEQTLLTHKLWFSKDSKKWLVKYDSGTGLMTLTGAGRADRKPASWPVSAAMSLTRPAGGMFHLAGNPAGYKFYAHMLPEGLDTWVAFIGNVRSRGDRSVRSIAKREIKRVGAFFDNYTPRADSWKSLKVSGMPASQYIADYTKDGKKMVEYRTYILDKSMVYWFVFRTDKDKFASLRKGCDKMIAGLHRRKRAGSRMRRRLAGEISVVDRARHVRELDRAVSEEISRLGWVLWRQRKLVEAEKKFSHAVALDATNANAFNGLGWSRFNQGKRAEAKTAFQECVKLNAKHSAALNGLGWIAKVQGNTKEAIAQWEKAIAAAPSATASLKGLATTYIELKDYDNALKYYIAWFMVAPGDPQGGKGIQKVCELKSPEIYESLDLSTPKATVTEFTKALIDGDTKRTMACVRPYSHDYKDIKEAAEGEHQFFGPLLAAADGDAKIKVTKMKVSRDIDGKSVARGEWLITMKRDVTVGKGRKTLKLKAGETFKFDGNLVKVGDWWMIEGI